MSVFRGRGAKRAPAAGLLAMTAALALSACARVEAPAAAKNDPVKVEKIQGTTLSRLTLEAAAATRIGLKTETVGVRAGEGERTTVPYSALLYDTKGATSVYTNPEPLVFVRQPVRVDSIEGDVAFLLEGPPPGTSVVTAGGAELAGSEFGVGK